MCPWLEKSGQSKASLAFTVTESCFFHLWYWLLNTLNPSISPCYCRAGLRKEEPNTGNISSLRFSSVHLLMARTPCSKTFVGVLKHHPVQAPDEDRIFRCHWHLLMAVTPYPFSNKELCIHNISCPFWGSVRCGCPLLRKYLTEDKRKGSNPESSLLLHKSQKFLKTHGNPRSDIYSSLMSHCTILTLIRPCGNKHIRTGTGQVPSEKTVHNKSRVSPKSTSLLLYCNKYKKTTFWAFIRGECDQWPRLPLGLFTVPPFSGTVMLLGVVLTQVLLFQSKHKNPSHAH